MPLLDRRRFLMAAATIPVAAIGTAAFTRGAAGAVPLPDGFARLRAAPATTRIVPAHMAGPTEVWAFEGAAPGPAIRVRAGGRVRMRLENGLPQDTSVHWHGIRIDNAMDGAAGLTQEPVAPGETFDYDFVAPDPGTYWYHSHDRSWEQNARGLHGPLIVEEAEPWGGADREVTLVVDDWRLLETGQIDAESFGAMMDWAHGGRLGNVLTVNGRYRPEIAVRAGERIRFRLINAANARIMGLAFEDCPTTTIALDGHAIAPRAETGPVVLAPAQRADVVVDLTGAPSSRGVLAVDTDEGSFEIATLAYSSEAPVRETFGEIVPLPDTMRHAALDLPGALRAELLMEGGAMGSMSSAMMGGRRMGMREMMGQRRVWAFNGVAGDMDVPLATVPRGRTTVFTIRNDTRWPHAMHLHGHHFKVLSRDGAPDPRGDWRDTELMGAGETIEIAFDATNPGRWLLHCHMLEHQAGGMITWFEVT